MSIATMLVFILVSVLIVSKSSGYPYYYYYPKDSGSETTCNAVADIVFLYDASGSIVTDSNNVFGDPQVNFQMMKDFMSAIVDEFNPVGPTGAQFAALCFSTEVVDHFYLNEHGTAQDVKDAISAFVTSPNQRTAIGKGLERARDQYFLAANGGKRDCAKEFIILLTDGVHNEGEPFPVPIAEQLKNDGVVIVTVGIGNGTNEAELEAIASPGFKFDVENFSALSSDIDVIVQSACAAVECTSETGGDNNNNHYGKMRAHGYKDGQTIQISVPVNVFLPYPSRFPFGGKKPFGFSKYSRPLKSGPYKSGGPPPHNLPYQSGDPSYIPASSGDPYYVPSSSADPYDIPETSDPYYDATRPSKK